jgi:hypothetical protein
LSLGLLCAGGALWHFSSPQVALQKASSDDALLALIKNDQKLFEDYLNRGGQMETTLPALDGVTYTVGEGLAQFERVSFIKTLQAKKVPFLKQKSGQQFDALSIAVSKNNPDLFELLLKESALLTLSYGKNEYSLLHLASISCAQKLLPYLANEKNSWSRKAKDGSTPLTLAATHDCLGMLGYWKEMGANFNQADGRGKTAMQILKSKKDPSMMAFVKSFDISRKIASVAPAVAPAEISFYKKRKIPKDQMVDYSALVEPETRPLEANETAEYSEFSD